MKFFIKRSQELTIICVNFLKWEKISSYLFFLIIFRLINNFTNKEAVIRKKDGFKINL